MLRLVVSRLLLVALVLVLLVQPGWADPIPWDYSSFFLPGNVTATPNVVPFNSMPSPGVGTVTFQAGSGTPVGTSSIVLAYWSAFTTPGFNGSFQHQPLQLGIGIFDSASNTSRIGGFTAYLDGTLSDQGANLRITYPQQPELLTLGTSTYAVTLGDITQTPFPIFGSSWGFNPTGSSAPMHPWIGGTIDASVEVQENPEPSTMVLLGAGGSLAAFFYYRGRRQTKLAAFA